MKKVKFKFLLMIAFLGLAFVAFISFSPNVNGESGVVRDTDVYVSDGESLIFDEQSQMQHYIRVSGSGNVTFSMTFDNYYYRAGDSEGCMEVILDDSNISSLLINISVIGYCAMYGDNHPGLRVPGEIPVLISFYMEDYSEINIGSMDGSKAIRNSYDTWDNIDYRLVNVSNAQEKYEQLLYSQDDECLITSANGDPNSNYPADEPYQPSDNPQSGESVIVNFSANDNIVSKEVTLPHSFMCDFSSEEGELDFIIQQLYDLSNGGFCDSNLPVVFGESSSSIECSIINEDNLCITINEALTGSVIVEGSYYGRESGRNELFNYSIEITTVQTNPEQQTIYAYTHEIEVYNETTAYFVSGCEMTHHISIYGSEIVEFVMIFDGYNFIASQEDEAIVFDIMDSSISTVHVIVIVHNSNKVLGSSVPGFLLPNNTFFTFEFIMQENSSLIIGTQDGSRGIRRGNGTYNNIDYFLENVENTEELYNKLMNGNDDVFTFISLGSGQGDHEHIYKWRIVEEPTCYGEGYEVYACIECDQILERRYIEPLGHDFVLVPAQEATTEHEGWSEYQKCQICGVETEHEIYPIKEGHEHTPEWVVVDEPTCQEHGYEICICSECGERLDERYIGALDHTPELVPVEKPTCEGYGINEIRCSVCDELIEVLEVEPLGHDFITVPAQEATTEHEGWSEYQKCQTCGVETEHEIYPIIKEPTVVTTEKVYIGNGDSILFNNQSQMQHYIEVSGSGDVTFDMTFDNYKYESGRWAGCMEIKIESVTSLYVNIIVKGDCELIGGNHPGLRVPNIPVYLTFTMEENSSITFGSQDENWGIQNGNDEASNVNFIFNNVRDEDSVRNSLTSTRYTIYSADYGVHDHIYEWVIYQEPTCEDDGYKVLKCTICGEEIQWENIDPLGHDFVWEINTEPTCEESGERQQVCQRCGELGVMESIEPLGHNWGEPTYMVSEDFTTITARRVCLNDNSHVETETVGVTVVDSIPATCDQAGQRMIISEPFENPAFAQQEISVLIEALGHNWSEPTYEWSKDYTTLTATRVCLNDNSHVETETVEVTLVESIDPTCEDNGERFYISAELENSAFAQQEISIVIEALGHDLIYHKAKAATFDEAGWDEYYTCSRCDYVSEYNIRPILERPDMDNPEAQEEFKEQVTQNITNIIGDSDTQEEISDNIANTPVEVLADIIDVVGSAYNAVNDMFADTEEGEKIEVQPGVELTKEEAIEIIQSVTMSTIVIAGSQESQIEAATELTNSLPADTGIDMGGIVSDFYERVLSELLSSPNNNNENVNSIVHKNNGNITNNLNAIFNSSVLSNNPLIENMLKITVKFNPFDKDEPADANASSGIDYSVSAETYQNAIEFVNTSVNNMADAALRIRQCSGEAMKSTINHYISGVSVQSFRDFDRAKADQEFAEAAYKAILISLQETVMNSLTENFEKAKAGKSGRALKDLEEAYKAEMEQVSHLHFLEDKTDEECEGCFEDVVIEVMRLKFLSILNNKRDSKEITDELFTQYAALAVDEETFAPVYKDIFFCWATGTESNLEIEITLQELSDAAIENTSTKINPESVDVKMLPVDWIILSSFVLVALGLGVGYFLISRKKKGAE